MIKSLLGGAIVSVVFNLIGSHFHGSYLIGYDLSSAICFSAGTGFVSALVMNATAWFYGGIMKVKPLHAPVVGAGLGIALFLINVAGGWNNGFMISMLLLSAFYGALVGTAARVTPALWK